MPKSAVILRLDEARAARAGLAPSVAVPRAPANGGRQRHAALKWALATSLALHAAVLLLPSWTSVADPPLPRPLSIDFLASRSAAPPPATASALAPPRPVRPAHVQHKTQHERQLRHSVSLRAAPAVSAPEPQTSKESSTAGASVIEPARSAAAPPSPSPPASGVVEPRGVSQAAETEPGAAREATSPPTYLATPKTYPPAARRLGLQGEVTVSVLVSAQGRPVEARVSRSSGYAILDEAAVEAVQHWRFAPARRGGEPVPERVQVPVLYDLSSR